VEVVAADYELCGPWMKATSMPRYDGCTGQWSSAFPWVICVQSRLLDICPYHSIYVFRVEN